MESVVINLFPNFAFWKLHSLKEYLLFFLMLASGIALLFYVLRRMKKARTPAGSLKRITEAVQKQSHGKARILRPASPLLQGCDLLVLLNQDLVILKNVYTGYFIQGSYHAEQWKISDNSMSQEIANPLPFLQKDAIEIENLLKKNKIENLALHYFVLFSDNYAEPEITLDDAALPYAQTLKTFKDWLKKHQLHPHTAQELEAIQKALEPLCKVEE